MLKSNFLKWSVENFADFDHDYYQIHTAKLITWNPKDTLPTFPPQVEQVQYPFMIDATATPNIHTGSFNQTLKY
jgi:hypothetical protein